ncbi:alpha/beta fold hydrolase [Sphingomonas crusticola]|uniref:alpha/beta fold hydrolase n=1 Tax=Sphingomonas crusticola TaxID=1697973 RepID=UPI000E22B643|nr:alpha/beta fold hydrolase [Sphingomonas crusticola]
MAAFLGRVVKAAMLSAGLVAIAPAFAAPASTATACNPAILAVGGNRIWASKAGAGTITVVFEAGFGNDSTVWSGIEPRIRAAGVQTFVYDRAGMGRSVIDTRQRYSLDNDVHILRTILSRCGIAGPIIFVGHSYGGAIGLAAARHDRRLRAMVLLDAVVPGVWTPAEVDRNLKSMRPQYDEIRRQAPALAKVAIPFAEAMPRIAAAVNALPVSERLPITDIKAEKGQADPDSARVWYDAHVAFTTGHPARRFIFAKGSGHKVMADESGLVVGEIRKMIDRVATPPIVGSDLGGDRIDYELGPGFCMGFCLSLKLVVFSDGSVRVRQALGRGRDQLPQILNRDVRVTADRIAAFRDRLAAYRPEGKQALVEPPQCREYVTDQGDIRISWVDTNGVAQLAYNFGCDPELRKAMAQALYTAPALLGIGDLSRAAAR